MRFITLFFSLFIFATSANSQNDTYPNGVVKALVGYPAGQTTDILARLITEQLAKKWESPVIVENIPGAGSTLAATTASRAKKDGQTILFTANAGMTVGPHVYENLSYQPLNDFEFINMLIWVPYVCSVNPDMPVTDISSLRDYIKENPGTVAYGSSGVGSMAHLTMEMLKADYGFDVLHVPFKGSTAVLTSLASGDVQFACEPASVVRSLVEGGRIKPIAVTSEKRLDTFPDLPTIDESFPGFTSGAWVGVAVPKGVPSAVVKKLDNDISEVLKNEMVIEKIEGLGLVVMSQSSDDFTNYVNADYERFGKLIKTLDLDR